MSRDGMADVLRREMEAYKNRNPDPKPEPALLYARTQAEWHLAQQALIDSQTSPEALMLSQGMVEGTDAAAQQGEKVQEQRKKDAEARLNNAKRDLEEMRKGEFRAGGIGRSGSAAGLHPRHRAGAGTGPDPTDLEMQQGTPQGPTPQQQMPGQEAQRQVAQANQGQVAYPQEPTHQEAHGQAAQAHQEAAGTHEAIRTGTTRWAMRRRRGRTRNRPLGIGSMPKARRTRQGPPPARLTGPRRRAASPTTPSAANKTTKARTMADDFWCLGGLLGSGTSDLYGDLLTEKQRKALLFKEIGGGLDEISRRAAEAGKPSPDAGRQGLAGFGPVRLRGRRQCCRRGHAKDPGRRAKDQGGAAATKALRGA